MSTIPHVQTHLILVRYTGAATYVARIKGLGWTASCTSDAEGAVRRVAEKKQGPNPYRLRKVTTETWILDDFSLTPPAQISADAIWPDHTPAEGGAR